MRFHSHIVFYSLEFYPLTSFYVNRFLTLNLTVTATDGDFKKLLAKLEEHVKNITVGEHMIITGFTLHDGYVLCDT